MTLTLPALSRARRILWIVTGSEKRAALARLLAGDRRVPAGRVPTAAARVLADRTAAPSPSDTNQ
jgi:6-phosphogluconolactonase